MIVAGSWDQAGSLLWNYLVFGYYQLYFVVVLLQLYLVFPCSSGSCAPASTTSPSWWRACLFALALAADLHYTQYFGVVGHVTKSIASVWPWARDPITYQEQFVAGVLVALHFDQVRGFVERRWRQVIAARRGRGRRGHHVVPDRGVGRLGHRARLGSLSAGGLLVVHRGGGRARMRDVGLVPAPGAPRRAAASLARARSRPSTWPASPVASSSVTCSS